ncbi:hypothetical protein Emed_003430 [Eimeria media]
MLPPSFECGLRDEDQTFSSNKRSESCEITLSKHTPFSLLRLTKAGIVLLHSIPTTNCCIQQPIPHSCYLFENTLKTQPREAADFEGTHTETAPCDDFNSNQNTESAQLSDEHPLVIDLNYTPQTTDVSAFARPDLTAAAASALVATAAAENYRGLSTAEAQGVLAGKTVQGRVKLSRCGASNAVKSVLLLLLLAAFSVATLGRLQAAQAKGPATDAARGGAVVVAAAGATASATAAATATLPAARSESSGTEKGAESPSSAEGLKVAKAAELDAAAVEAAAEAAAAATAAEATAPEATAVVHWSVEATQADARWLARRLNTKTCNAAAEKFVKALSDIWLTTGQKQLTPGHLEKEADSQREREQQQQQQQQVKDARTLLDAPESPFEGFVSPVEELLDGLNALLSETRMHLQAEYLAAYQKKVSLVKALMPLSVLREDATKVCLSGCEDRVEAHHLAAELVSDFLEKNISKLDAVGRGLRLEIKKLRAAAASRPDLLLKRAIIAVKSADEIQAKCKRLLQEGMQWCDSGEKAALLFAQEKLLKSKIDLFFLRQTTHLKMLDMKSFQENAALLAAHESLLFAASRLQQSSVYIHQIEMIMDNTKEPFLAIHQAQTAASLLKQLHAEVKTASALLTSAKERDEVETSEAETEEQQNAAATASVSLETIVAREHRQEEQKEEESVEDWRMSTNELRSILSALINSVINSESRHPLFRLGTTPPRGVKSSLLPFPPPSRNHFEVWKKTREDAQQVLNEMRETAKLISMQTTRQSLEDLVSKLQELEDTFRFYARKGIKEFHLCKTWLQAESFLADALEEHKSSLRLLATLQGKGTSSIEEETLAWKASVEAAIQRGVHETILMAGFINDETFSVKRRIAEVQARFRRRDE